MTIRQQHIAKAHKMLNGSRRLREKKRSRVKRGIEQTKRPPVFYIGTSLYTETSKSYFYNL